MTDIVKGWLHHFYPICYVYADGRTSCGMLYDILSYFVKD